ncbi:hypothetical protein [Methylosinus sp. PW1]|uniref:hypothetical protein n=1 Tax=Methylosinus sp. PW1 TaxID=107636 RepID=UPI0018DB8E7F|nr:hypothetical protein [Methylosinus sp. PW1]
MAMILPGISLIGKASCGRSHVFVANGTLFVLAFASNIGCAAQQILPLPIVRKLSERQGASSIRHDRQNRRAIVAIT